MQKRETRIHESYKRVKGFLVAYPAPDPQTYAEPQSILEQVLEKLETYAQAQQMGVNICKECRKRVETTLRQLRSRYLRPVVAIARAHRDVMPGIDRAMRMPETSLSVSAQLRHAEGIRGAAARFAPLFVKFGMPDGFVEQFAAAIAAVEDAVIDQVSWARQRIAARRDIEKTLLRGRDAVNVLDTTVRFLYEGNGGVLRAWESDRRVKALPGTIEPDADAGEDSSITPIAA